MEILYTIYISLNEYECGFNVIRARIYVPVIKLSKLHKYSYLNINDSFNFWKKEYNSWKFAQ